MKKNEILAKSLFYAGIILSLYFVISLIRDYVGPYKFGSAPFYVYIIVRIIQIILPAIFCFIISLIIKKRNS